MEVTCERGVIDERSVILVLPARSVREHPSQPAQDVEDEALSVLIGWADFCASTQRVQQLLVEVWELQHSTALDPEEQRRTNISLLLRQEQQKQVYQEVTVI